MAKRVVPNLEGGHVTDGSVDEFRRTVLTLWIWRTSIGRRFLRWFWKSRFGLWLTRKFENAEPPELHGYAYWGPVAIAIAVVEILAAPERLRDTIPWPTISGTVGHIQDINSLWSLAVVGIIAATAFYAVSYVGEAVESGRHPFIRIGPLGIRYGWPLVYTLTAIVTLITALFISRDRFHLGYAIYGSFALIGIVVPMLLVWRGHDYVVFPSLFFTFGKLRTRFRWIAMTVMAGLTILVLHLALYPWPNLAREPASYAGLNAYHAEIKAREAIRSAENAKSELIYSTQGRGVSMGRNVWFVYFNVAAGGTSTHAGCVVEVTSEEANPSPECLR